jgi:5-methylcytosine-specific restriction endonuclease McrA
MESVIVLTKNYQYWREVGIHKVLHWYCLKKIEIIVADETTEIGSVSIKIPLPFVVRLLDFVGYKPKQEAIKWSPEAVYNRDGNYCQYWHLDEHGHKHKYLCSEEDRSIDHILPKDRGGKDTFENTVCSCTWHNVKVKKNRLPAEAGMELIRKPFVPRRDRTAYVTVKFTFNKNKPAHKIYLEKFLGGILT